MQACSHQNRRRVILGALVISLSLVPPFYFFVQGRSFPADTTPEGAYLRIVLAVRKGRLEEAFPYLETEAQWACYTTVDYHRKIVELVRSFYPEPERGRLLARYEASAAAGGERYFAAEATRRGWERRLRQDLSGIASVEVEGERASVQTVQGTRYPFRRRENGIWGLTLFTAELKAEATAAARDIQVIERSAMDYKAAP
ncbi:MAG: hypothetical protein RMJ98_07925 [Myxococcales bacterium]|nr:hypothetical protein [Polyangiaceae bacterium]MDW8249213.1 hypothetical protein [Myxococcales bacterium]